MAALESAERAARALLDVPLLFMGAAALGVLKLPVEAFRPLRITVGITVDVYGVLALLTFAFTPILLSGLYGLAASGLRGSASPDDYVGGIRDGYLNLVVANVLYALVQHVLLLVFFLVALVVVVVLAGSAGIVAEVATDPGIAPQAAAAVGLIGLAGLVLVSLTYLIARVTVAFFMQLYRPSAVIGGNGPLTAFRESAALVRANLESTIAFVLLRGFVVTVLVLPGVVALAAFLVVDSSLLEQLEGATVGVVLAALLAVLFVVGVVELAFLATHRVAFYRSLVAD